MPDLSYKDLYSATLTDQAYAMSVARWLSSKTERSQEIISSAARVLASDQAEAAEYIESLSQDILDIELVKFSEGSGAAEVFTVEEILTALNDSEVTGLTSEEAEMIIDDLSGSTAAVIAASVGVSELCSKTIVSSSDLVASIEANVGGLSDQMLSVTSVIVPVLGNETMSVGDKVRNVLAALGLYKPNGVYSGFGPLVSDLHDFTGASGIQVFCSEVVSVASQPKAIVEGVWNFVTGAVNKIFGSVLSKAKDQILDTVATLSGYNDATIVRQVGHYTDYTCDYASTYFKIPVSEMPEASLSKLSHEKALHLYVGFGSIDFWYADDQHDTVNMVVHWAPVNPERACIFITLLSSMKGVVHVYSPADILSNSTEYDAAIRLLFEAVNDDGDIPGMTRQRALEQFAAIFNSEPATGSAGVSDLQLLYGIMFSQMYALTLMSASTGHNFGVLCTSTAAAVGLILNHTVNPGIVNADLIRVAAMSQDVLSSDSDIIHDYTAGTFPTNTILDGILDFVRETLFLATDFSVSNPDSIFIPYYYISSYVTGKYSIRSDSDVTSTIRGIFWLVGAVAVTLLVIATALTIKKQLWVAQNSLDYQLFAQDIGENPRVASQLYKKSCRINRANSIVGVITGSVKGGISKLSATVVGLTNAITGKIGGLIGSGSVDAPGSEDPASLESIKELIAG